MCVVVGVVDVICSLTKGKSSFPLALASPGHPPLHLLPHWKCRMWKERRRKSVQGEGGGESISIWRISPPVTKFSLADSPPGHAQRVRRCFTGSKHTMGGRGGRTRPIQCKICTLPQIIFISTFDRPIIFWQLGIFANCDFGSVSNHTFDGGIRCICAIQQRFAAFVFLGVEICQIAWFGGCISVP